MTKKIIKKIRIPLTKSTDMHGNEMFMKGTQMDVSNEEHGDDIYTVEVEIEDGDEIAMICIDEDPEKRARYEAMFQKK